jgi:hypothetical protein
MLRDPGTFWHTVAGEQMLRTGELIRVDSFTFSQEGQPWLAQQWLGELVMALVHRAAGLDGLLVVSAALLAAAYSTIAGRLSGAGVPLPGVVLLVALTMGAGSYHFLARPHLVTIALTTWVFGLLCDVEAGRARPARLLMLPAALVAWTNLHGGALGGLATVLIVLLGWLLRPRWMRSAGAGPLPPVMIGVVASLCGVAVLVNPYGPALPAAWLGLMSSAVLPRMIVEHAPPDWLSAEGAMILSLAGVYGVLLVLTWRDQRRLCWLMPAVWLVLAAGRVRHGPLFAVTAAVAVAEMIPFALARRAGANAPQAPPRPARPGWIGVVAPVLAVGAALGLSASGVRVPLVGAGWARAGEAYWPVRCAEVLERNLPRLGGEGRVFNDMRFGGYLIYRVPGARVYIDDRCELHGDAGLRRYAEICRQPELLEGLAAQDRLAAALVMSASRLDRHLAEDPRWELLCRDGPAALYGRRAVD